MRHRDREYSSRHTLLALEGICLQHYRLFHGRPSNRRFSFFHIPADRECLCRRSVTHDIDLSPDIRRVFDDARFLPYLRIAMQDL